VKKVFEFLLVYVGPFAMAALLIYWAITAEDWASAIVFSGLASFDILWGLTNVFGKKDK
jgi:hypothetical protein